MAIFTIFSEKSGDSGQIPVKVKGKRLFPQKLPPCELPTFDP